MWARREPFLTRFDLLQPEQTLAETISVLAPHRGAAIGAAAG
jgi:hypothetical protein